MLSISTLRITRLASSAPLGLDLRSGDCFCVGRYANTKTITFTTAAASGVIRIGELIEECRCFESSEKRKINGISFSKFD